MGSGSGGAMAFIQFVNLSRGRVFTIWCGAVASAAFREENRKQLSTSYLHATLLSSTHFMAKKAPKSLVSRPYILTHFDLLTFWTSEILSTLFHPPS